MSSVSTEFSRTTTSWSPRQLLSSCRSSSAFDLRVVCASGPVARAHTVVLSRASTTAFTMLSAAAAETESEPVSVLTADFSLRSVEALLRLIYEGVAATDDSEEVLSLCKAIGMHGVAPENAQLAQIERRQIHDTLSDIDAPLTEGCDTGNSKVLAEQSRTDMSPVALPRTESPLFTPPSSVSSSTSSSSSSTSSSTSTSSSSSRTSVVSDVPKECSLQDSVMAEWNESEVNFNEKMELTVKLEENLGSSKDRQEEQGKNYKNLSDLVAETPNKDKSLATEESNTAAVRSTTRVLMSQLDPSQLTCSTCGKMFTALYRLKLHQLIHSTSFPFSCQKCSKGFNNKYKMRVHTKKCSGASSSAKLKLVKKPVSEAKTAKQIHECIVCGENFEAKAALAVHLAASHPDYRKFICSHCGRGFRGQKALDRHSQSSCPSTLATSARPTPAAAPPTSLATPTATASSSWRCLSCPTVCSSRKSLKIHCKVAHLDGGPDALPFKCADDQCGKAFLKQSYLEEHVQRFHSSQRQFACMYCPKRFSTKQDLSRHLSSHDGRARFACEWCDRAFVHRANRAQHVMAAHTGERPYACRPCARSFGLLCVLRKHQKAHQRKGDNTVLVTAPKGRRGCISYIDFADAEAPQDGDRQLLTPPPYEQHSQLKQEEVPAMPPPPPLQQHQPVEAADSFAVEHNHPVYIPGVQYLPQRRRRTFTPLSQMQVVSEDFGPASAPPLGVVAGGQNFGLAFAAAAPDHSNATVDEFVAFGIAGEAYPPNHQPQQMYDGSSYQSVQPDQQFYYQGAHYQQHHHHLPPQQPLAAVAISGGQAEVGHGAYMQSAAAASEEMTETEAIAMDLMGLFTEPAANATQTPIQHL